MATFSQISHDQPGFGDETAFTAALGTRLIPFPKLSIKEEYSTTNQIFLRTFDLAETALLCRTRIFSP